MIKDAYGNTRFYGLYRGIVYRNDDPDKRSRLQLKVPQIFADQPTGWAWSSGDNGTGGQVPAVGAGVWVMFEGGDPSFPVWIGAFNSYLDAAGVNTVVNNTTVNNVTGTFSGGKYGAFQYTGSQEITDATKPYTFSWNTTDYSSDVYISNTTRIYFPTAGVYNIQWSGQFQNTNNVDRDIYVWLAVNGADVLGSTGVATISGSHGSLYGHNIVGWNYYLAFTAGQYLEIKWGAETTDVSLVSYPVGSNPTRPTTSALVLTATQVA